MSGKVKNQGMKAEIAAPEIPSTGIAGLAQNWKTDIYTSESLLSVDEVLKLLNFYKVFLGKVLKGEFHEVK